MSRRNIIKGVLHNFLETYTSRYADYDGYWLWGILITDFVPVNVDLLLSQQHSRGNAILISAVRLAIDKFRDQLAKHRLDPSWLRQVNLTIERSSTMKHSSLTTSFRQCYDMAFIVKATSDTGRVYEAKKVILVAPHDPSREVRSARFTESD